MNMRIYCYDLVGVDSKTLVPFILLLFYLCIFYLFIKIPKIWNLVEIELI
jgi:hypothetical protein